jgi:hypothetical protein
MFLVKDDMRSRERKLRQFIKSDASIGLIFSEINFEWILRRAIIALGSSSSAEVRAELGNKSGGMDGYKQVWNKEVYPKTRKRLCEIIPEWMNLMKAIRMRNILVDGVESYSWDKAAENAITVLRASKSLIQFCNENGVDVFQRLPVRRRVNHK